MPPFPAEAAPSSPLLSKREREVLDLLARGTIDKDVAERLGISLGTVRVYRKRMQEKLGVRGSVQCLLVAWRLGEIDLTAAAEAVFAARRTRPRARPLENDPDEDPS